jgi:hypothetical protein
MVYDNYYNTESYTPPSAVCGRETMDREVTG